MCVMAHGYTILVPARFCGEACMKIWNAEEINLNDSDNYRVKQVFYGRP